MAFIEELFPLQIDMGSTFSESFAVELSETSSGNVYKHEKHPYPVMVYEVGLQNRTEDWIKANILAFFRRMRGAADSFRVHNKADFSTNNFTGEPTATDQICLPAGELGVYQIIAWYGTQGDTTQSRRRIRKPKAGTGRVSIGSQEVTTDYALDYTKGEIAFIDNPGVITSITQQVQAVVTVGSNDYEVGDWAHISGVAGMADINGGRYEVTDRDSTTITIDLDTTGFDPYDSGGEIHTAPQDGEIVRAGCKFDIPMFVVSPSADFTFSAYQIMSSGLTLQEHLNP